MNLPKRKPTRLPHYSYSTPGAYFITVCTKSKRNLLGKVVGGGALDAPSVHLSTAGKILHRHLLSGNRIPGIKVDKFIIMPNHFHLIILVEDIPEGPSKAPAPTNAVIPHFISTLKCFCHRDIGQQIFQRSFHDHIIRCEQDYLKIWNYIDTNPAKWQDDCFYNKESSQEVLP